jgi:hypothetical protein
VWHAENIMFFKQLCWNPACVNRAIIEINHDSSFMWYPSSRKDPLFDRNKYICYKIGVIHFAMIWESVDNIEAAGIPYDCKHEVWL